MLNRPLSCLSGCYNMPSQRTYFGDTSQLCPRVCSPPFEYAVRDILICLTVFLTTPQQSLASDCTPIGRPRSISLSKAYIDVGSASPSQRGPLLKRDANIRKASELCVQSNNRDRVMLSYSIFHRYVYRHTLYVCAGKLPSWPSEITFGICIASFRLASFPPLSFRHARCP